MKPLLRGDVVFAGFDPVQGREQGRDRPAVVLSVDTFNLNGAIITVLPITSKPFNVRTRVAIQPPEGGLKVVSFIICEQPRTISLLRVRGVLGALSAATMVTVSGHVRDLLGL